MGLREEIAGYIDGEGMVAPNKVAPGSMRGSDNGPVFTSEYYVMLSKLGQLTDQDKIDYANIIGKCIDVNGLLNRHQVALGDNGQEGPDDYYGVLDACKTLGNTDIPRKFLKAVVKYLGFLNNNQPGVKTGSSFLIRQPQLVAAMIAAAFPSWKNPIHVLTRLAFLPWFAYAAVCIAIAGWADHTSDADARRLSWHLIQTMKPVSLLAKLASKIWYNRLYSQYGATGMKSVADIYYQQGHPFQAYWVD